jgi:hypothetical protein
MPSNHILINNALECFVPDSKMEDVMRYLEANAYDWQERADRPITSEVTEKAIASSQTVS